MLCIRNNLEIEVCILRFLITSNLDLLKRNKISNFALDIFGCEDI